MRSWAWLVVGGVALSACGKEFYPLEPEEHGIGVEFFGFEEIDDVRVAMRMYDRSGFLDSGVVESEYDAVSLLVPPDYFAIVVEDMPEWPDMGAVPTAMTDHGVRSSFEAWLYAASEVPTCSGGSPRNVIAGMARVFDPVEDRTTDTDEEFHRPVAPENLQAVRVKVVSLDGADPPGLVCRPEEGPWNFILHDVPPGFHELTLQTTQHEPEVRTTFLVYVPEDGFAPLPNAVLAAGWTP